MSVILLRHAQSHYNQAKKKLQQSSQHGCPKNSKQLAALKMNPHYRDSTVTSRGFEQAEALRSVINLEMVEVIMVSPMRRCLQTCRILLQNTNRKVQVKVLQLLKGRLNGSPDHGSSLKDLKFQYPQFNFESLTEESQIPWYLNTLDQKKRALFLKYRHSEQDLYNQLVQNYQEFKKRVERLKQILRNETSCFSQDSKVLVISHSCMLRTLTAQKFDHKGKAKSSYKFDNARPISIPLKMLIKYEKMEQETQGSIKDLQKPTEPISIMKADQLVTN